MKEKRGKGAEKREMLTLQVGEGAEVETASSKNLKKEEQRDEKEKSVRKSKLKNTLVCVQF